MLEAICILVAIGFFANAMLHILLVIGRPLGEYVLGGRYIIFPYKMRFWSFLFAFLWIFIGLCYLNYGKIINVDWFTSLDRIVLISSTLFLFFATCSNGFITKSKKERMVMPPFSLITFLFSIIILII